MKASFVTFLSPGTFVNEETTKPIPSWDVDTACKMARGITERHGATPYAFFFTIRERTDSELDSKETQRSGLYFLGGTIMTLSDVERKMPNEEILISNMRSNKIKRIVVNINSYRSIHEFGDKDEVLDWPMEKKS